MMIMRQAYVRVHLLERGQHSAVLERNSGLLRHRTYSLSSVRVRVCVVARRWGRTYYLISRSALRE
jgi:hypothetical protein